MSSREANTHSDHFQKSFTQYLFSNTHENNGSLLASLVPKLNFTLYWNMFL